MENTGNISMIIESMRADCLVTMISLEIRRSPVPFVHNVGSMIPESVCD
jgi:hypothetical protein